jgi:phosphoenolpyruvate carboxykinase (GTP)
VPAAGAIDIDGLDLSDEQMAQLFEVDPEEWAIQLPQLKQHYATFGDSLPEALRMQLEQLEERLTQSDSG